MKLRVKLLSVIFTKLCLCIMLAAIQNFSFLEWFGMFANWFKIWISKSLIFKCVPNLSVQYSSPHCISCPYTHSRLNYLWTMLMSPSLIIEHRISCNSNVTLCSILIKTLFFRFVFNAIAIYCFWVRWLAWLASMSLKIVLTIFRQPSVTQTFLVVLLNYIFLKVASKI